MYKGEKRYFKDVSEFIKKSFDEKFQGSWHVISGIIVKLRKKFWFILYL